MSGRVTAVRAGTATLALPAPLRLGPMLIEERGYAAVEVETDDGLVGKAYCLNRGAPVAACVEQLVAPVVVGREADPERLWEECSRATVAIGRTGLVVRALGLVDIALWDIVAQAAGAPLWRHLGGTDPAVRAMMVAAYPLSDRTPESLADDVIRYGAAGFTLLKVARDPTPLACAASSSAAAAGLPETARLVVDGGYGWRSSREALAELPAWGDTPLAWLEDPLVPEDAEGCAAIRRECGHPVGVGDEVTHIATFRALLDAGALDILRLDVPAIGGITPARRVQELAADRGVTVSLHIYPEVSVHLAALRPGTLVETFDAQIPEGTRSTRPIPSATAGPGSATASPLPPKHPGSASSSTGRASGAARDRAPAEDRLRRHELPRPRGGAGDRAAAVPDPVRQMAEHDHR